MRILFVGDIVGEPGREAVSVLVPRLRQERAIDVVIANGENAAGGKGITPPLADELFSAGVNVITSGDHLWDQKEVVHLLEKELRFLRPLNYPAGTAGHGSTVIHLDSKPPIGVINVQGLTFMQPLENPFNSILPEVERLRTITPMLFVDMHAETTSEKIAMGRLLDGKVSAVVGTHTHVQTADEQVFPGGTAFLCDAGFTGPQESVLGRDIEPVIRRFRTQTPQRFTIAKNRVMLHGALIDVDETTGRATAIRRVAESLPETGD